MGSIIPSDVIVIGVDPGIRNTAITTIHFDRDKKNVIDSIMLKSVGKSHKNYQPDSVVLNEIGHVLLSTVRAFAGWNMVIGVEAVFQASHRTAVVQTAKVIGVCDYIAGLHGMQCIEVSPPTVKKALGLKGNAKKDEILPRAEKLLGRTIETHHVADSIGVCIATHLKLKRAFAENKAVDAIDI